MTKVVAINRSPRKDGNVSILIGYIFKELEEEGAETELVQVGRKEIRVGPFLVWEVRSGTSTRTQKGFTCTRTPGRTWHGS
ncbi:MAG: NAD(P)H-dependent oxidoreductase [Methanomicrobiales archaeon]